MGGLIRRGQAWARGFEVKKWAWDLGDWSGGGGWGVTECIQP